MQILAAAKHRVVLLVLYQLGRWHWWVLRTSPHSDQFVLFPNECDVCVTESLVYALGHTDRTIARKCTHNEDSQAFGHRQYRRSLGTATKPTLSRVFDTGFRDAC
jgi:hypothetical protein